MPERDVLEEQLRQEFRRQAPDFDLRASLPSKVSALVRRRQRLRLIILVAAVAAVVVAVAIPLASLRSSPVQRPINPATGSTSGWSAPTSIDSPHNRLTAVSCATAHFCVAVDYKGNAITYNGTRWSRQAKIDD